MATTPTPTTTAPPAAAAAEWATRLGRGAARRGAAAAALTALTALCVLGSTATAAPGIAAAALGIDYEKAGNFPTLDACADAGHTMPDIKTWLCDEEDDGTVSGTVRA